MTKIVISGYYGFNNVGDESILEAIINQLKKDIKSVQITVLSANPQYTSDKYHIHAIDRKSTSEIIKAIRKCDLFISGGGSLLQDVTSHRSITYYLGVIGIALLCRKKVLVYSQGIGPINKRFNQKMVKWVLQRVACIIVRDENSKHVLNRIGVKKTPIYVTADPVIGLNKVSKTLGEKILQRHHIDFKKLKIGFAIRKWHNDEAFIEKISQIGDALVTKYDAEVVFIPFHFGEDRKIIGKIEKRMTQKAHFMTQRYNIEEMLSLVGNLDILIGVRLHSLIFAAIMNTPLIAISYDPKIDSFMKSLNENVLCSTKDLEYESLVNAIENIQKDPKKFKMRLKNQVNRLKNTLKINEKVVTKLLDEGGHRYE